MWICQYICDRSSTIKHFFGTQPIIFCVWHTGAAGVRHTGGGGSLPPHLRWRLAAQAPRCRVRGLSDPAGGLSTCKRVSSGETSQPHIPADNCCSARLAAELPQCRVQGLSYPAGGLSTTGRCRANQPASWAFQSRNPASTWVRKHGDAEYWGSPDPTDSRALQWD